MGRSYLLLVALLLAIPSATAHAVWTSDNDGDGILDEAESNVCGRRLFDEVVLRWIAPFGGGCAGADYTAADESAFADVDGDGIADGVEDLLCGLENSNDAEDGSCVGNDYTAPNLTP